MADAALWMTAAEPALGLPHGTLADKFAENQTASLAARLDGDLTAQLVMSYVDTHGSFLGTHGELLKRLVELCSDQRDRETLPRSPNRLSETLKEIAPALRSRGYHYERATRRGLGGARNIAIKREGVGAGS
jgi:hypothetical protein